VEAGRDLKQIQALLKLLRTEGVTRFTDGQFHVELGPLPAPPLPAEPQPEEEREWTAHERLFADVVEPDEGEFHQ
jgi:hypothetical protein